MRLYHVVDIEWDTDDENPDELGLPDSAYVNAESEEEISDVLSDFTGYCVKSLSASECFDRLVFLS